jgi:hypothetical protein
MANETTPSKGFKVGDEFIYTYSKNRPIGKIIKKANRTSFDPRPNWKIEVLGQKLTCNEHWMEKIDQPK